MNKPKTGFFSFTCCQGCQFTILFIDELLDIFKKLDVKHFHLLKEKNRRAEFDLAFVEGAITTKREVIKLKKIRNKTKFLVAVGACACHGGIPSNKNFLERSELQKYVYNQEMLDDSIKATGLDAHVKVDYYMRGCPIIKEEFVDFVHKFIHGEIKKEFQGPVCNECPRRGKDCLLKQGKLCLGALTHGGCDALCPRKDVGCIMCRGPLRDNFANEIKLFKNFGLSEQDIKNKLSKFKEVKVYANN